jgi:sugar phosphate isomerase/epimerase
VEKAKEVQQALESKGLSVWSIGSRLGKIGIKDDFAPHLEEFCRTLETARVLKCDKIRLFSFYVPQGEDPAIYEDEVMKRLGAFAKAAKGSGIQLCHENEKGIYGDNAKRCLDIAKNVEDIRLVFDPANFVQCGVDTLDAWNTLKNYVSYVHIKDATEDGTIVPAGAGCGNVEKILADYKSMGGGVLTLEPHLTVFDGLASLEREGEHTKIAQYSYPDAKTAFIAAHDALVSVISKI